MKIKSLHIKNFKSLVDLEIVEPNPFTVFVGANGVGKSNIFEALEFAKANITYADVSTKSDPERYLKENRIEVPTDLIDIIEKDFGGHDNFLSFGSSSEEFVYKVHYLVDYGFIHSALNVDYAKLPSEYIANIPVHPNYRDLSTYKQFYHNFSRVFLGQKKLDRLTEFRSRRRSDRLFTSGENLDEVLKRLLKDEGKREDIIEYLQLMIPEFGNLEIHSDNIGGSDTLLIFEKGTNRPFNKTLISDGTYNILCLLTALYQSDEPQFLCIEEPENGLTPYAIEVLVELFRSKCEEMGHYIWLNSHSQTLVRLLEERELVLVNKINGATSIKQLKQGDFYGLRADDAWLTNALGAGLPW